MPRKTAAPKVSEAQIQQTCSEFLALDGWRRVRTDMKQLRGMGVQEPGMADDLFIRYDPSFLKAPSPEYLAVAEVLWVEWKRTKGMRATKPTFYQQEWHRLERARGALTWIAGVDFPATIEGFQEHYRKSGLARRSI